jgi:hypothetical protein
VERRFSRGRATPTTRSALRSSGERSPSPCGARGPGLWAAVGHALETGCSAVAPPSSGRVASRVMSASVQNPFRVSIVCASRSIAASGPVAAQTRTPRQLRDRLAPVLVSGARHHGLRRLLQHQRRSQRAAQDRSGPTQGHGSGCRRHVLHAADLGPTKRALLFTSSQLLVAVAPTGQVRSGARSPWFPVGDVPPDGVPVGTAGLGPGVIGRGRPAERGVVAARTMLARPVGA